MDLYADHILEHYRHPRHRGRLEGAQYHARQFNPLCGDEAEVFVNVGADGAVSAMQFVNQGCAISTAALSLLAEHARGQTLPALGALTDDEFLARLNLTPTPGRRQCALLGLTALKKAVHYAP
ncbi:MAG: iron-sulfur cluster assembly scaffold protein [bacterium]|nr:iron-sulfur cluster assembly scaffold protein [bacterium]MDZ4296193.1 iron-sulfur cluster assembly scaffold protein [Patescibacteria group bacterium]